MTDKTREDFESDLPKKTCVRNEHGDYVLPSIADRWAGYQAATQHSAARIAELEAEVQALRKDAEWIECAKQMPPPDTKILVVWDDHQAVDKAHTFSKWKHPTNRLGYLIQGHPGSHNDVTHWKPLPPAPGAAMNKEGSRE